MQIRRIIFILTAAFCFYGCQKQIDFNIKAPSTIQINQNLVASISIPINQDMQISYAIDGKQASNDPQITLNIKNYRLGKHVLTATIIKKQDTITKQTSVVFLAAKKPKIYRYKVINSYPHDRTSFTQGLEFYNNELYESTGQRGSSVLRKVALKTGKVLKEQPLASKYFGEGMTIFNHQIYQLTWQGNLGFVYDVDTFKTLKTFAYNQSKEGWGLTHNHQSLIKSDGTKKIWFLNPLNGQEQSYIEVYTNKRYVDKINELEYVDGKIYANVWMKNAIAIINPKNGAVEALINLKGLANLLDNKTIAESEDKVLNGIAYNTVTNKLYVTGKNWDKLFEIEILK